MRPASVEVEKPIAPALPPKYRPTWNVETILEPAATASGSTSVACWPFGVAVVSVEIRTSLGAGTWAAAGTAPRRQTATSRAPGLRSRPGLIR